MLRGGQSYRHARHKIFKRFMNIHRSLEDAVNPFLLKKTFTLRPAEWIALSYDETDWRNIEHFTSSCTRAQFQNMLLMLESHIALNLKSIKNLESVSDELSRLLLTNPDSTTDELIASVAPVDRQSLFFWRLLAAAYCRTGEALARQLRAHMKTEWLQNRFMYPFAFSAINLPPDYLLPTTLSYVLSGKETRWEAAIIQYAAGYLGDIIGNESGFLLASLLMHPYDALELLTDCLVESEAAGIVIDADLLVSAERIFALTQNKRLGSTLGRINGKKIKVSSEISLDNIKLPLSDEVKERLIDLVSLNEVPEIAEASSLWGSFVSVRLDKYPRVIDFDNIVILIRAWRFTEAGRMLKGYCASLFLFPRSESRSEYKDFCALTDFFGCANAFILTSPGLSYFSARNNLFEQTWSDVETFINRVILPIDQYDDRCWIKVLQYKASLDQRSGRISNWISALERYSPIKRNYICGADWNWLQAVLDLHKVHPFRGDLKAAYVFLLKDIEQNEPHHEVVKSILRPLASANNLTEFLKILMEAYGSRSAAFFYHFLTQENILRLSLAFSEIEALAGRISALTAAIKAFGFCEIVTEDIYADELRYLTAAISYRRISASEFEVPWASFSAEQATSTKDLYDPIQHFSQKRESGVFLLGEARTENRISFPNGVTVSYTLKNYQWATAYLVIEVIKNFMQHPGYGLEAILGTRIRHNVMVREFDDSLDLLTDANIPGTLKRVTREIILRCRDEIKSEVSEWVDTYIHSSREAKPQGKFNLVPSQVEIGALIEAVASSADQRNTTNQISSWIQTKLRGDLSEVRLLIKDDLVPKLSRRLLDLKLSMTRDDSNRSADLERVVAAASAQAIRTADRVVGWFEWPEQADEPYSTLREVCGAVHGRFERYFSVGQLHAQYASSELLDIKIARENVRMLFDIFSEFYFNAIKYANKERPTVRVSCHVIEDRRFIVISNKCEDPNGEFSNVIQGSMYQSIREHVMRVGETGLYRIAGSYATIARRNIEILSTKRNGYFHVALPVSPLEVEA